MHVRTLSLIVLPFSLAVGVTSAQTTKPTVTIKPAASRTCASVLKAKVNLNKSSMTDLECLPGVTKALAKDIVINRPIKNAQDFQTKIEMVGRKLWKQMGQYATF